MIFFLKNELRLQNILETYEIKSKLGFKVSEIIIDFTKKHVLQLINNT